MHQELKTLANPDARGPGRAAWVATGTPPGWCQATPVLSVTDHLVARTRPYQGRVRMTMTYPALTRARQLLWLVTGRTVRSRWPGLL
jgi:hypothetical protein